MLFSKSTFVAQILALALVAMPAIATHAQTAGRPAPKVVELTPSQNEVEVGQKIQFSAIARDSSGKSADEKATAWFAAPFDLASAAEDGTVTFFQPGVVTVGAIVSGRPVFKRIKVNQPAVKTIEIDNLNAPLPVGGTVRLQASARVFNGDPRSDVTLSWISDNSKIARVDAAGVVTGVAPGKATITVTAGEAKSSIQLNVSRVSLRGLTVEPANTMARTGDVIHFKALPQGARESYAPRWAVTGEGGRIDADGGFVAELPGSYIVSATIGERVATASVVITPRNVERDIKVIGRSPLKDTVGAEQWIIGNYAYYSTVSDRFLVFDISDPSTPTLTDTINVDARIVNDISTTADGRIIVISREGASNRRNGIAFYDASDPARPKLISEYTETVTGGVHSAFVDGHYVYLTDDATGSMRVVDFRDVKNPKEVARWQVENPVATMVRTAEGEQIGGRYLHDVYVKDGLAYLAYWRDGLVILDVGNGLKGGSPEKPQLVSQFRFNHNELYGNGWLAGTHTVFRYKNYVFVGDEVFPAIFNIQSRERLPVRGIVHVIDVSNIETPRKVAEYSVPEAGAHNVWVENDMLYMGYYTGGARVVDVSGELRGDLYRQGREIANLWTGDPNGFRPNMPFAWGAQPHKDMIFFNDMNSGLWIVKLGDPIVKGSTTAPGR